MRSGLDDTMRTAYGQMRELWKSRDDVADLRSAAYTISIYKVAATTRTTRSNPNSKNPALAESAAAARGGLRRMARPIQGRRRLVARS